MISDNKGKGRGLLCRACKMDFDAGRMMKWTFNGMGRGTGVPVTVYESMDCECNCYGILDDKIIEDIEAWPANHPDLAWAYKPKPSTKSTMDEQRSFAVAASMVKGDMVPARASEAKLLQICDAMHRDYFLLPQELQAMSDPSLLEHQDKIRWGYRMRGVSDIDIEAVYLRGLTDPEGWFNTVPEHGPLLAPVLGRCCCQWRGHSDADNPDAEADSEADTESSPSPTSTPSHCPNCGQSPPIIDWHHARLGLIFLILYGQRISYVRDAKDDPRFKDRLLFEPSIGLTDLMHGNGRIGMRKAGEGRDGVVQFRPRDELNDNETVKRLENMQYFLEAIAFKRMPGLKFSADTGAPLWTPEHRKFRLVDRSCKAEFADQKGAKRLKAFNMKFEKVDTLLLTPQENGVPHIVGYLKVGFASIIAKADPDTPDYAPRRWLQQAIEVAMAWSDLQREVKSPTNFRPISDAEHIRLRGYVIRYIQLYREHQGATRLSNYLCLWMTMVITTQMTQVPLAALCNECAERKIGGNRKYTIHETNHSGNCDSTHYNTAVIGITRPPKTYGLGWSMRDYMLGELSIKVGRLYQDVDENLFLQKMVKLGAAETNRKRRLRYAEVTNDPVAKQERKRLRTEYLANAKVNLVKRLTHIVDRLGNPERHFQLAAPTSDRKKDKANSNPRRKRVYVPAATTVSSSVSSEDSEADGVINFMTAVI